MKLVIVGLVALISLALVISCTPVSVSEMDCERLADFYVGQKSTNVFGRENEILRVSSVHLVSQSETKLVCRGNANMQYNDDREIVMSYEQDADGGTWAKADFGPIVEEPTRMPPTLVPALQAPAAKARQTTPVPTAAPALKAQPATPASTVATPAPALKAQPATPASTVATPAPAAKAQQTTPASTVATPKPAANAQPATPASGLITTASGLQINTLVVGTGDKAEPGQTAVIHYTGWLPDGTRFDSSVDRGIPVEFTLGEFASGTPGALKGIDEGVATMHIGGKVELIIPPDLAWGQSGLGVVPPNATVKFEVELLNLK